MRRAQKERISLAYFVEFRFDWRPSSIKSEMVVRTDLDDSGKDVHLSGWDLNASSLSRMQTGRCVKGLQEPPFFHRSADMNDRTADAQSAFRSPAE
jgi:hypothetical protein